MKRAARLLGVLAAVVPALAFAEPCPAGMKRIRSGSFRAASGEGVEVAVEVAAFCMDVTEVTVVAYRRCVDAGACPGGEDLLCGSAATIGSAATGRPVNCVTWFEADAFCRAHGKRLPTESEWEWAARGTTRARTFPWGEAPPANRACWDGEGNSAGKGERTEPCQVGSHRRSRSPDGIDDLAGNVREWTATEVERFRVVRGGSWGDSLPEFLSAGFRGWNAPDERMELTGFRCVAEPGAKTRIPRRQFAKARAVMRDDGVLEMPLEERPRSRRSSSAGAR